MLAENEVLRSTQSSLLAELLSLRRVLAALAARAGVPLSGASAGPQLFAQQPQQHYQGASSGSAPASQNFVVSAPSDSSVRICAALQAWNVNVSPLPITLGF